jgi:hypothetical protein
MTLLKVSSYDSRGVIVSGATRVFGFVKVRNDGKLAVLRLAQDDTAEGKDYTAQDSLGFATDVVVVGN